MSSNSNSQLQLDVLPALLPILISSNLLLLLQSHLTAGRLLSRVAHQRKLTFTAHHHELELKRIHRLSANKANGNRYLLLIPAPSVKPRTIPSVSVTAKTRRSPRIVLVERRSEQTMLIDSRKQQQRP